jgi:uncharacterized protein (DUF362 family)
MQQTVALARVEDGAIDVAVRQAVELAGGLSQLVGSSSRVLVKPNLWSPQRSGTGSITDARVTEAVTRLVLDCGPARVVIGEGCGAGYDTRGWSTEEAFRTSGTGDVAQRLGVELRNLNTDQFEEVVIDAPLVMDRVKIARTVLESDVIISVPVLKSHIRTHVTLSLKNMKGVIPGAEKRKTHRLGLDEAIVDLNSLVGPHFVVLDAIVGMQGLWDYPADAIDMGLIVAGADALSVDCVGARLMGVDPQQVMHLKYMAQREGTSLDIGALRIVGESIDAHSRRFTTGFDVFAERFPQVTIVQGQSACTGCTSELVTALTYLDKAGYSPELGGLHVVIGNAASAPPVPRLAVLGKCALAHAGLGTYAAGCPPREEQVLEVLCRACGVDETRVLEVRDEARQKLWRESETALDS